MNALVQERLLVLQQSRYNVRLAATNTAVNSRGRPGTLALCNIPRFAIQEILLSAPTGALRGTRAAMVVDLTIVLPQIHLNNSFRFGKGPHPRKAHFAVYTAIQENSLQNRQQRF